MVESPPLLRDVVRRAIADLVADTGIGAELGDRGDGIAPVRVWLDDVDLHQLPATRGIRADGTVTDERYGLTIADGGVDIWAATPEGVYRGLTTLRQLLAAAAARGDRHLVALRILDGPRFAWRGLGLDVVRTFHGVETVERVIEMCARYKLNVLHLHLTDDEGWRFEVPGWPRLSEVGGLGAFGGRPGGFYSMADVERLVAFAEERFVTIVPEVDLPGHAGAAIRAYPELAPLHVVVPSTGSTPLGVARSQASTFSADALAAAATQFRTAHRIHVGGDRVFGVSQTEHTAFLDAAIETLRRLGRHSVAWQAGRTHIGSDEIIHTFLPLRNVQMAGHPAVVEMAAEEAARLTEAAKQAGGTLSRAVLQGAGVLLSPVTRVFLDRPHGDAGVDAEQEARRLRLGLPYYGPTTLRTMVQWDPATELPAVHPTSVAGIEAMVWCETVEGRSDLEALLLPRLPGIAERAWSAELTEWDEYLTRLRPQTAAWDRRGWAWYRAALLC